MNFRPRFFPSAWMCLLICLCGFVVWIDWVRIQHVEYATGVAGEARKPDAASPTVIRDVADGSAMYVLMPMRV